MRCEIGKRPHTMLAEDVHDKTSVVDIQPSHGWTALRLRDVWAYRELLYFLVWRDIKVRYKQTALGAAWAVIQPFFTMVVFSLFFGRLANFLLRFGCEAYSFDIVQDKGNCGAGDTG